MNSIEDFARQIGVTFNDISLLERALTHRSYLNEIHDSNARHNERLEFLGDAVLELVMTEHLFHKYPSTPEGELTAYRSALVKTETISKAASELRAGDYLRLSKGEARDTGKARMYILANTYEAILGAVYLDQGYDAARNIIANTLFPKIDDIVEQKLWKDPKSLVQEHAQEQFNLTPSYRVVQEKGPDHDKTFTVAIYFGSGKVATGVGRSKQIAEMEAAKAALLAQDWD